MLSGKVGIIVIVINFMFCLASAVNIVEENYPDNPHDPENDTKIEVCDKLKYTTQCFSIKYPFFDPQARPVSVFPDMNSSTSFLLYTRKNTKDPYIFLPDEDHLRKSNYEKGKNVTVLVHGYGTDYKSLGPIRDELLSNYDLNVFLIDWKDAANDKYFKVVANARIVAHRVLNMLLFLMKKAELKPHNIHLIGASVGAQLVGYVGKNITDIGRITGLDPAGPYFETTFKDVRLRWTDAIFVDTIRTNRGSDMYTGLGYYGQVGHADFIVNGGNHQPQCDTKPFVTRNDTGKTGKQYSNQCSHVAAADYFASSIKKCVYKATTCVPFEGFDDKGCEKRPTNRMGFFAHKPEKLTEYYLDTETSPPYCKAKK